MTSIILYILAGFGTAVGADDALKDSGTDKQGAERYFFCAFLGLFWPATLAYFVAAGLGSLRPPSSK